MSDEAKAPHDALKLLIAEHHDKPESFSNRINNWQPLITRMATMLRRLEWAGSNCGDGGPYTCCPSCHADPPQHAPDCDLATLLRELP